MTINEEFDGWLSLSDMLLGKDRKTPAELECALEQNGWFYFNARGRIVPLDSVGRDRALKLLADFYKRDEESKTYPYDKQPPSDFLNTGDDPSLCSFRLRPNSLSKNEASNLVTIKTESPSGKMPRIAIGQLAVKIAWQIEQETGKKASAKQVMAELQKKADDGTHSDVLMESDRANKAVKWFTTKSEHKPYGIEACQRALRVWNKSRH
jgi:hypothetical protein